MADSLLGFVDPYSTPWDIWASDVTEQLSSYNAPSPGLEDSWKDWAAQISAIPAVAELGSLDPEQFETWQAWGAALLLLA